MPILKRYYAALAQRRGSECQLADRLLLRSRTGEAPNANFEANKMANSRTLLTYYFGDLAWECCELVPSDPRSFCRCIATGRSLVYIDMYIYIYIYIRVYKYIHIHIYIYTYVGSCMELPTLKTLLILLRFA